MQTPSSLVCASVPYSPPSSSNTRPGRAPDGAIASLQVLRFKVGYVQKSPFCTYFRCFGQNMCKNPCFTHISPRKREGLGGRSRRSPAGEVASLRKVLRFSSAAVPGPCFPVSLTGSEPNISQHAAYQLVTKQRIPNLPFFQETWNHLFSMILII